MTTRKWASQSEVQRYMLHIRRNVHIKDRNGGTIGIYQSGKRWRVKYPAYLRIRDRLSDTAVGAAMEYNRQMLALFGDDAVLCDVNAAMELDRRRK